MKNAGTPAIEDSSASGSDGGSVEGRGGRRPERSIADEGPVTPFASDSALAGPPGADFPRPREGEGVLPCERWAWICGAGVTACGPARCPGGGGTGIDSVSTGGAVAGASG